MQEKRVRISCPRPCHDSLCDPLGIRMLVTVTPPETLLPLITSLMIVRGIMSLATVAVTLVLVMIPLAVIREIMSSVTISVTIPVTVPPIITPPTVIWVIRSPPIAHTSAEDQCRQQQDTDKCRPIVNSAIGRQAGQP